MRVRGVSGVNTSLRSGESEIRYYSSSSEAGGRGMNSSLSTFVLFRPSVDWMMPTHTGDSHQPYRVYRSKCQSHSEIPTQTHPEIMFHLDAPWPVKLPQEINHYGCATCVLSCLTFATPWTVVHQAPLSMGFPRQEYWSRLPFPSPGDHPYPGIEPMSPVSPALAGEFFTTEPPGKP